MSGHGATNPVLAKAWDEFHAAQQEVLGWMTDSQRFKDVPQHRARAYHTMMEALAMAYNFAVAPRMEHPRLFINTVWQTDMYTLGQNGPDLYYAVAFLDGKQTYRLKGKYNDSVLMLGQVIKHLSGHPDSNVVGNYDFSEFELKPDGSFEIIISATKHEGNWMSLDPESGYQFLLFRRFMRDWNDKKPEMSLERISDIPVDHYDGDEFDEIKMAERIDRAKDFIRYLIRDFNMNLYEWYVGNAKKETGGDGFNNLVFLPGTITSTVGSPLSNYAMAIFNLAEDEALILELDQIPDGVYWSYQLGDVWSRSLNYMYRQTSVNMHHGVADSDGGFRAVVAHKDPGVANWLDTCGRVQGAVVFRNYVASRQPVPKTRLVKFSEIKDQLPKDTAMMTPEQRAAALRKRHEGVLKLHGE
ncbi:MAG: DUF1214 domain-containing protein [Caulobacterales bacterium]